MSKLALLPTGEAIRPQDVKRVRIKPGPALLEQEVLRYAVVLELVDEAPWTLKEGSGLVRAYDAETGKKVWTSEAHGPVSSSLWGEEDTLLRGTGVPERFGGAKDRYGVVAYRLGG